MNVVRLVLALAVAAVVAAIAMPNLIEARRSGNESAAIGGLRTISTSQSMFREQDKACGPLDFTPGGTFRGLPDNTPREPTGEDAVSTFSVDVDTASYATVRQFLRHRTLPPADAVRVEELINAFSYDDAPPEGDAPFAVRADVAACPWAPESRLVRIGLKGREVDRAQRPPCNLVFLIDVSGSMAAPARLPLIQQSLGLLTRQLGERDRIAVVVYAGAAGLALPSTPAHQRGRIQAALARLQAGGSTNGGAGIQLAYRVAVENFVEGGVNRVILATDGDFNVGLAEGGELDRFIAEKARSGVFLSVFGFGLSHHDARLEALADRGDGVYGYVDSEASARRLFVEQLTGTLVTIAKDVKVQVRFDPARVASYRLIGYADRLLEGHAFTDDAEDAGEVGAGHTVTALYQVAPKAGAAAGAPLLEVAVRAKPPVGGRSAEVARLAVADDPRPWQQAPGSFRLAAAVAAFGLSLRDSPYRGAASCALAAELAAQADGAAPANEVTELRELIALASDLTSEAEASSGEAEDEAPRYGSLQELGAANVIDPALAGGLKQGYRFETRPSPTQPEFMWMTVASPVVPGTTGDRWFATNHTGQVYSATQPIPFSDDCTMPPFAKPLGQ